jgi:hypothetical protein
METLKIYNELKSVPEKYLKTIDAGRLKGMSDIKPQWRIEKLTELFGPCGIGWKITDVEYNYFTQNTETVVNCRLKFQYKWDNEWSEPIPASGGSKISTQERNGLYVSDEAEKMAFTDALSVAGKMIGLAGDIYIGHGSKYDKGDINVAPTNKVAPKGQNMDDDKPWLNIKSPEFAKVTLQVPNYSADDLVKLARKKYKVSKDTEQAIRALYRDNYEEIVLVD